MTIEQAMQCVEWGASDGYARVLADEVRRLRELLALDAVTLRDMVAVETERDRYREALTEISKPWRHKYAVEYILQDCQEIARDALRGGEE